MECKRILWCCAARIRYDDTRNCCLVVRSSKTRISHRGWTDGTEHRIKCLQVQQKDKKQRKNCENGKELKQSIASHWTVINKSCVQMAMNLCSIYIYFYGRCFSFIAKRCVVVSAINLGIQHLCRCPGSISIMPCNWRLCFTLSVIYIFILLYSIRLHALGTAHATNNNMAIILYNSLSNFFRAHIQLIECSLLVTWKHTETLDHTQSNFVRHSHFIELKRFDFEIYSYSVCFLLTCQLPLPTHFLNIYNFRNQIPLLFHCSKL